MHKRLVVHMSRKPMACTEALSIGVAMVANNVTFMGPATRFAAYIYMY